MRLPVRKLFLVVLVIGHWSLAIGLSPVQAACRKDDGSLGCTSGTCQQLIWPATSGPNCDNFGKDDCWCVGGTPPIIPPPTSGNNPVTLPDTSQPTSCNAGNSGDLTTRPVPCDACSETYLMTPACADTFSANDTVTYSCNNTSLSCDSKYWIEGKWNGTITVNPKEVKIPFVGGKGYENQNYYLADYFEGTYYYNYNKENNLLNQCSSCKDQPNSQECLDCKNRLNDIIINGGVFPKLAPKEVQDDLKVKMIKRAQDGAIHNYKIKFAGLETVMTDFVGHYPPRPEDFENAKAWMEANSVWNNSTWGKLWPAVPMFSREDTPGKIIPYVGTRPAPYDSAQTLNPENEIEKVPHVARLYEVTSALQQLLLPSVGSSVLGTTTGCVPLEASVQVISTNPFNYALVIKRTPCAPQGTLGDIHINPPANYNVPGKTGPHVQSMSGNELRFDMTMEGADGFMPQVNGIDQLSQYAWTLRADRLPEGYKINFPLSFSYNGIVSIPPPPKPTCELEGTSPVGSCKQEDALVDYNFNDNLCCDPIKISLTATDKFENACYPAYQQCLKNCERRLLLREFDKLRYDKCLGNCEAMTGDQTVSRQVGVSLSHPYLYTIWQQTNDLQTGLFNIFRPASAEKFSDKPAVSSDKIKYDFKNNKNPQGGYAKNEEANFYFPYLGGIQEAKEWVIKLLGPAQ